ncbi:MAG: TcaA NTF2-like domain-containing protein [Clostridium sp.]|uniref:TcaA NTF2-like domain-containing protein n=1 Tax=Clostridium sp. TaxID=1506 RepID=UPI003EE4AAF9
MKFCKSCGTEIGDNIKFCKGCGKKLFTEEETKNELLEEGSIDLIKEEIKINLEKDDLNKEKDNKEESKIEKKKRSNILIIGLIALLAIVCVGGVVLFKGNSPESVVENFEVYLKDGKIEKLKEILVSESSLEINDENVEILIEGLKEAELDKDTLITRLKEECKKLKESKGEISTADGSFYITKKKEGLKDKYYIGVNPAYISLPENIASASYKLTAGEKAIDINLVDGKEHMLMPTIYKLEGKLKNDYIDTKDEKILSLLNEENVQVKMFEDINKITLETNDEEALLIINGKNTKNKLKDSKVLVGLKRGDIIQGIVEKDGKVRMSPKYAVEGTGTIFIELELEKVINHLEYTNSVEIVMEEYIKRMEDAINYNDFSAIKNYLYPGSQIYNEQIRFIKNTYESGIREQYVAHFIDDINFNDEKKEWTVKVNETFDIHEEDGETKRKIFNNEYKLKVNEDLEKLQITFIKVNYKK